MAEDNKIVLKVQVEQGGSTVTLKNFENQVIKSGIAIKDLSNSIGNFTTSKLKMDGQVKVTTDQFKRLEKSVGGFKTAAGAGTSATLELGRVLSDMPYGIRGVANNLQQLASNLFFMSKATDVATGKSVGFGGALKNLVGGLIGPAGILIAFQGIIALFDYFSTGAKKAEKETNNLNLSIGGSATKLKALKKALDDGLMSREEANEAVNAANKEFKDLNLTLSDNVKLTEDSVLAINNKIEALVNLSKAQALQALLEKKYSELLPLQAKQSELDAKATEAEINAVEALSKNYKEFGTAKEEALASSARSAAKENERAVEKIEKDISDLLKLSTDNGILDLMFNGKKGKGKKQKREKVSNFDLKFADPDKDIKDAKNYLKAVARGLGIDMKKNPLEVDTDLDLNLTQETKDRLANAMAQITKDKVFSSKLREYSDYAEQTKEVITAMNDFATSEFDRELTIEQNKTNALNNELNKRLLNENLSADERERIQNKIAQNDEKLRVKQEAIERKRFKMQKAANIATALIDTFRAAAGVMAEEEGGFLKRLSAAIPTIAFGMAQVAAIARQKFQSSSGSRPILAGGGVSGGSSERAEPSFNIVGRSNDNILMSAIQSQFDQPLRAYVVARDVTNQQQLDGVISGAAST